MEKLVNRAIRRYLKKHYPDEMERIIYRAAKIRPKLMRRAPDPGGKENIRARYYDFPSFSAITGGFLCFGIRYHLSMTFLK